MKSALKKSSTVDEEPRKGLGKRQKSFVQFDDNAVVIDDGHQEAVPVKDNEKEKKFPSGECS